jgi:hypothetical protein
MYDRAPRVLTKGCGSTAEQVGPGSYDPQVTPVLKIKAGTVLYS